MCDHAYCCQGCEDGRCCHSGPPAPARPVAPTWADGKDRALQDRKSAARAERKQDRRNVRRWKRESRDGNLLFTEQELAEFRCFWTWRFGHVFEKTPAKSSKACMACGKVVQLGSYGGGY